jgi:hypothetical protein
MPVLIMDDDQESHRSTTVMKFSTGDLTQIPIPTSKWRKKLLIRNLGNSSNSAKAADYLPMRTRGGKQVVENSY